MKIKKHRTIAVRVTQRMYDEFMELAREENANTSIMMRYLIKKRLTEESINREIIKANIKAKEMAESLRGLL